MNLELYLNQFLLLFDKSIDLKKIFCRRIRTNPIPNSIADRTKKKNVRESKLILSYKNPIERTIKYKVIHKISAVNNRCRALLTFRATLRKKRKKIIKYKLISPKNKN